MSTLHVTFSSAARIDAKFDTPVSRNGSNVFKVIRRTSRNGFNQSLIESTVLGIRAPLHVLCLQRDTSYITINSLRTRYH